MFTIGQLRELIKDLSDDALILQRDFSSEYSFEVDSIEKGYTKLDHSTPADNYYTTWTEENFEDFIADNLEDENEIRNEYKVCLLI